MGLRIAISDLPAVRGKLVDHAELAGLTWFRVGGPADILFQPADEEDLRIFLRDLDTEIPVHIIGVGSNVIVRDGGVRGVVIRLGSPFRNVTTAAMRVTAGAGAIDAQVAKVAAHAGIAGLEFLRGVPGTIGGAIAMNAGAYGGEVKDRLVEARAITRAGEVITLSNAELGFSYRHCDRADGLSFISATFEGEPGEPEEILSRMDEISAAREASQPIRERTGGSTFANPDPQISGGRKAWQLVDEIGGRGRVVGDAQVSEQHCNFVINRGSASAQDLETLIESLRKDVLTKTGVELRWEIKRIGETVRE